MGLKPRPRRHALSFAVTPAHVALVKEPTQSLYLDNVKLSNSGSAFLSFYEHPPVGCPACGKGNLFRIGIDEKIPEQQMACRHCGAMFDPAAMRLFTPDALEVAVVLAVVHQFGWSYWETLSPLERVANVQAEVDNMPWGEPRPGSGDSAERMTEESASGFLAFVYKWELDIALEADEPISLQERENMDAFADRVGRLKRGVEVYAGTLVWILESENGLLVAEAD